MNLDELDNSTQVNMSSTQAPETFTLLCHKIIGIHKVIKLPVGIKFPALSGSHEKQNMSFSNDQPIEFGIHLDL